MENKHLWFVSILIMTLRPTSLHLCPMSNGLMLSFSPSRPASSMVCFWQLLFSWKLHYLCIYSGNLGVCLLFFRKTTWWISLKLRHSLLSTVIWVINYKPNVLLRLLSYKMRNLSKFTCFGPNSWSFLVHFFAHGILSNYRKLTTENWPRDAEHIVVVSYLYQIKQYPLSVVVFASFLGVISNTDHRHFCLPNFLKALNHTSVANQLSSFANTMYNTDCRIGSPYWSVHSS